MPRYKLDDMLTIEEVAEAIGRGRATVYNLARDHQLHRYRLPARGKTTFLRWGDVQEALATPIPKRDTGKEVYYKGLRLDRGRCPQCGSDHLVPSDDPDARLDGRQCVDCGYVNELKPRPAYIAPGEPGSQDREEDYAP